RRSVDTSAGEERLVVRVMAYCGVIRGHVDRVCRDCDRRRECNLLPSGCAFVAKRSGCEQCSGAAPQISHMGASIGSAFVEADAAYRSVHIRLEKNTEFN